MRNLCVVFDVVGDYGAKVQNAFSDWETIEAAMEEEGRKEGLFPSPEERRKTRGGSGFSRFALFSFV